MSSHPTFGRVSPAIRFPEPPGGGGPLIRDTYGSIVSVRATHLLLTGFM